MLTAKPLSLLAGLLLFCLAGTAQTYTLDWGSSFSPTLTTNVTSGTATNINSSGRNLSFTMGFTGSGAYLTNYPQVNSDNSNSALLQVQNSTDAFLWGINLGTQTSYLTITMTFSAPVQNLNFGIADIDGPAAGTSFTYLDSVKVYGTSPTGATVIPTATKYNSASTIFNIDAPGEVSANPANGANVTSTAQGSPAQDGTAFFSFTGNAITSITFIYMTKNLPIVASDPGSEAVAIGNIKFDNATAPTATTITNTIIGNGNPAISISSLAGTDDESVASYSFATVPAGASGVLSYYNGTTYVNVTAGTTITAAQAATLRFDPDPSFSGNASFTYNAIDNRGLVSASAATYTIPVEPTPAPTANNILAPIENSSYAQTPIPSLSAAISAGSITSYTIQTVPTAASGILYLCNSICNPVTASQVIAPADIAKLKFDPAATFSGTASFTYYATSDAGTVSNTATYSIPVRNEPPIANTILAQVFKNTDAATAIPSLSGADADGTISSFTIASIPLSAEGTLQYCNTSCISATAGQVITAANADKLKFVPAAGYIGTSRFTYTATDNSGNISPAASYNIPVKGTASVNLAPYADNRVAPPVANNTTSNLLPVLSAHDADGTIASYTIETIPTAAQGSLTYCSNGTQPCTGTVTAVAASTSLNATQMATLKFTPSATFNGTASFTYSATDNSGIRSNIANYSIPVVDVAPVANPIVASTMSNGAPQTAIPALSGHSAGTISSYTISTIPSVASGLLYLCNGTCNLVVAGQSIAVADIAKLTFDPAPTFTGNASFNYTVTDNNGMISNTAPYTIPVTSGTIPAGVSPIAVNKTAASIASNAGQTALTALAGSDADGTVSSYVINSLPAATAGTLFLCNGTCAAVTAGQVIAPADIASLKFTPAAGYEGNTLFDYSVVDNSGKTSNVATFTIPVTNMPPVANNVQTANLSVTAPSTSISSLSGSDADGTVASYTINSLPTTASGVLYLCNGSCVAVTNGQVIVAADASKLQFAPSSTYKGIYSQFNYTATDNSGKISAVATYTIPLFLGRTLPVSLLNFTGRLVSETTQLSWTTENEVNFDHYVVERSTNGTVFTQLGSVVATTGSDRKTYSFNDDLSAVAATTIYYRLRLVDRDGAISYSSIILVNLTGRTLTVSVPNPVHGTLVAQVNSEKSRNASFQLIDNLGHVVLNQTQYLNTGINTVSFSSSSVMPAGIYTLRIVCDSEVISKRLIFQP